MKGHTLFKEEIIRNSENALMKFKNLFLENHCANYNQTWHKNALEEDSMCSININRSILDKELMFFHPLQIKVMI